MVSRTQNMVYWMPLVLFLILGAPSFAQSATAEEPFSEDPDYSDMVKIPAGRFYPLWIEITHRLQPQTGGAFRCDPMEFSNGGGISQNCGFQRAFVYLPAGQLPKKTV